MDMLSLALKTRLPFIQVTTDDILFIGEVLTWINEKQEVIPCTLNPEEKNEKPMKGQVYMTSAEGLCTPVMWLRMKAAGATLVFINTKKSVLHFNGGILFPPKDMLLSYLITQMKLNADVADDVINTLGGLTLKDSYEVVKLTIERVGLESLSSKEVNRTRQGYISKLKGIIQVDTEYDYYQAPTYLQGWLAENQMFLKNDIHPSLTPRGLLFDGPPGTGKTMGAKHLAQALGLPLYRLDIGGMKGKYVGDSEGNLIAALQQVDQAAPCVVILDEVEKTFGDKGETGTTTSMLSTLLWWLQEHKSKVFTVMTTNNLKSIPPELYREGRIDTTMVFNGLESKSSAIEFAQHILISMAEKLTLKADIDEAILVDRINTLFAGQHTVSQSLVTQEVHGMIKQLLVENAA
jgi:ATPase family associated with various cellular activities (AAA)